MIISIDYHIRTYKIYSFNKRYETKDLSTEELRSIEMFGYTTKYSSFNRNKCILDTEHPSIKNDSFNDISIVYKNYKQLNRLTTIKKILNGNQ